jgi:two-component system sensor kinase FixL
MTKKQGSDSEAGRALGLQQARWQAVLDTIQDAVVGIDTGGSITLFNRTAESIFGYRVDDVLGRNVSMLMPEPYRSEHDSYLSAYRRTGVRNAIGRIRAVHAQRSNGEIFPIDLSVSEARFEDQTVYTAIIRDVSERHLAETKLREMEKAALERQRLADVGAITAQIVHDLGNPLAAISMQGQWILRRARRDPAQPIGIVEKAADQIVSRVKYLDGMIREFLEFTREQRLKLAAVDLSPFLHEVIDLWRPLATDHGISIFLDLSDAIPQIRADEEKLRRVFENLVKNAVEAMGSGPGTLTIRVGSVEERGNVRISVIDTGPGIPQNLDIFRLFETSKPLGTGLGLPIARQIIMAHGGGIEVADAVPHGAIFHIDLPAGGVGGQ